MISWKTLSVVQRNRDVYLKNWKTNLIPPLLEPFVYLGAFGFGVGRLIETFTWQGIPISYLTFIAPGILATTLFNVSFFECLYGSFVRMFYQHTFHAMLNTPLEIHHIIRGEILWGTLKALFNVLAVFLSLLILRGLGWLDFQVLSAPLLLIPLLLAGAVFSSWALIFTAIVPRIDHFNLPVFLIAIPLGLTSNTYFPIDNIHPLLDTLASINPLYHLSNLLRITLLTGTIPSKSWIGIGVLLFWLAVLFPIAEKKMTLRVLGEDPEAISRKREAIK